MIVDVVVIGGGAAGFYAAIHAKIKHPRLSVVILEKSSKVLSKVRVSGGGRCNVTHDCLNPFQLSKHYPRGEKSLKKLFQQHHAEHVIEWFRSKGVELKVEGDGRMFPVTDNSGTIINCFLEETRALKIDIKTNHPVTSLSTKDNLFIVAGEEFTYNARRVLISIGGHAKPEAYQFLRDVGLNIIAPIPSLFTFNDSDNYFKDLMGVSVPAAEIRIASTKLMQRGPLLITHWGLSGPAVIKLSAWAAEHLHQQHYAFQILVNWIGMPELECRSGLADLKSRSPKQKVTRNAAFGMPARLWERLCVLSGIEDDRLYGDLSLKQMNKLVEHLTHCAFEIKGKTTFKEEFVTCGGVDLGEIDLSTMQSKTVSNLFFAGEVLNIDGETGGFNFQAAWTTGYIAAQALAS